MEIKRRLFSLTTGLVSAAAAMALFFGASGGVIPIGTGITAHAEGTDYTVTKSNGSSAAIGTDYTYPDGGPLTIINNGLVVENAGSGAADKIVITAEDVTLSGINTTGTVQTGSTELFITISGENSFSAISGQDYILYGDSADDSIIVSSNITADNIVFDNVDVEAGGLITATSSLSISDSFVDAPTISCSTTDGASVSGSSIIYTDSRISGYSAASSDCYLFEVPALGSSVTITDSSTGTIIDTFTSSKTTYLPESTYTLSSGSLTQSYTADTSAGKYVPNMGGYTVTGDSVVALEDYMYSDGTLYILTKTPMTISSTSSANGILDLSEGAVVTLGNSSFSSIKNNGSSTVLINGDVSVSGSFTGGNASISGTGSMTVGNDISGATITNGRITANTVTSCDINGGSVKVLNPATVASSSGTLGMLKISAPLTADKVTVEKGNAVLYSNWKQKHSDTDNNSYIWLSTSKDYVVYYNDGTTRTYCFSQDKGYFMLKPTAAEFEFTQPQYLMYDGTQKIPTILPIDAVANEIGKIKAIHYYLNGKEVNEAVNVGEYIIKIDVDASELYSEAMDLQVGSFQITKATPTIDDFIVSLPENLIFDGLPKYVTITPKSGISGIGDADYFIFTRIDVDPNTNTVGSVTEAGKYTLKFNVAAGNNYYAAQEIEYTIDGEPAIIYIQKGDPGLMPPTPVENLIYNTTEHILIYPGSSKGGKLLYSLNDEDYSAELPVASAAGDYRVYYKLLGGNNYFDISGDYVDVKIAPGDIVAEPVTEGTIGTYGDEEYTIQWKFTFAGEEVTDGVAGAMLYLGKNTEPTISVENILLIRGTPTWVIKDKIPAGKYKLVVNYNGTKNLAPITVEVADIIIDKRPIDVVIDDAIKKYGDANPEFSCQTDGLHEDDTMDDLAITLSTSAEKYSKVGTYSIKGKSESNNYSVTFTNGILTIEPRPIEVIGVTVKEKYYDRTTSVAVTEVEFQGLVNDETLKYGTDYTATAEYVSPDAGTTLVSGSVILGSLKANNYTCGEFTDIDTEIPILRATPVAKFAGLTSFVYGDPINLDFTFNDGNEMLGTAAVQLADSSGSIVAKSKQINGIAGLYSHTFTTVLPVGEYTVQVSYGGDKNYLSTVFTDTAKIKITKRNINVQIADKERVYGNPNPVFTFTSEKLVEGDTVIGLGVTLSTKADEFSNIGTYSITGVSDSPNYNVIFTEGTLTVNARPIAVTKVHVEKKFYNGKTDAVVTDITFDGLANGDKLVCGKDYTAKAQFNAPDAGTDTVDGTVTLNSVKAKNYICESFEDIKTNLPIQKAPVTPKLTDSKVGVYGDNLMFAYWNFDNGKVTDGGSAAQLINSKGQIAAQNENLVMNTAHSITWSILNPAHFDTVDGEYLPADEYTLKVKYLGSANYAESDYIEIGTLTVGKRDVNVVIDNKTKVYAEELPEFTFQHADLIADDTAADLNITLTTDANVTSNVGKYDITGISTSLNYNVIFKNTGILTIIKAIPKNPASPVITTPIVYGSALNTIVLKDGWHWLDGTIIPTVRNKGYDVYLEADYFNYDYTGIPGYNAKTERVERHIEVPVKPAPIKEVVITGIELPVGHYILDTTAECKTEGVEEISPVTWMDRSGKIVTKADYNKPYTSMVTLTADDNHGFDDMATDAIMYGVDAVLTVNNDDTATVYYTFVETAREGMTDLKIVSPIEKTQYKAYEPLDLYGLEIEAIFGRKEEDLEIYPEMISGFDSSTPGVKDVVISYGGFSVSFPVWVSFDDLDDTAKPVISPADGTTFSSYQKITFSCDTADAEFYYTLDGSQPTEDSIKYTGEFSIGEPCTVKVIAIKRGMNPSKTVSATFKKLGYDGGGTGSNTGGGTENGGGESSTGGNPETPALNGSEMSWNAVENALRNIPAGSYVTINMNEGSIVPVYIMQMIKDGKYKATFVTDNEKKWFIDGSDIDEAKDNDLGINEITNFWTTPTDTPRGTEHAKYRVNGTDAPMTFSLFVGRDNTGAYANVYRLVGKSLEFVSTALVNADGISSPLDLNTAGDYVVMISDFTDLRGDANNDGTVTIRDALLALKHANGTAKAVNLLMADYNTNGTVQLNDALKILKLANSL